MKSLSLVCLLAIAASVSVSPLSAYAEETTAAQPAVAAAATTPAQPAVRVVDAAGGSSNEAMVSMAFNDTPLTDVIKAFRDATGANIISSGTNLQGLVSVRLDNVPWKKGLSSILDPQGLQLAEQPPNSGIFVVTPKTLELIPQITQTFTLIHARADDVAILFKAHLGTSGLVTPFPSANAVIVTATEQQIGECEKIIMAIDKPRTQVYIEARFVEMNAAASKKLGMKWDSLGGEGWGVKFDGASLGITDDSTSSKVNTRSTRGSSTANSSQNNGFTSSDSLTDTFIDADRSIERVLSSESTLGSSAARTLGSAANMGYDKTDTHSKARTFTGSLSASAFALAINAFEQIDGVSVFSNPKVIVANEEMARVDMTTKEPNVEVSFQAATSDNGSDSVTTKLALIPGKEEPFVGEAFFSYGISLTVTPRVSPSGLITVQIEPSISEREEKYFEIAGINAETPSAKFPIIKMRRIKTVFTMDDGKTAVIGGLTRTTEGNVESGIPWLRSLPWIGPRVFGWKSREKDQREIIIFVTVGIADPVEMREDIGMPKNALFGRDVMSGKFKEPGNGTLAELLSLEEPKQPRLNHVETPAAPIPEAAGTETDAAKPAQ